MRASRGSARRAASRPSVDTLSRAAAERGVVAELDAWRARAVPDAAAPLGADDLVRLLRDLVAAVGLDAAIASGFTANTVHYYRRKDIIDPPDGRTAAARYGITHVWQIAGARLAGHLGLVTLAEAKDAIRGATPGALTAFVAARVADARARSTLRAAAAQPASRVIARPLAGRGEGSAEAAAPFSATVISLSENALCVLPAAHPARRSPEAARELVQALAAALRTLHSR